MTGASAGRQNFSVIVAIDRLPEMLPLGIELLVVAHIDDERHLVDQRRVAEAGTDRIDAALEGAELRAGAGIAP